MSVTQTKKKAFALPHVLIILLIIMVIVTALSAFIPSGEFARTELGAIDPTRFSYINNTTPSPCAASSAPYPRASWSRPAPSSPSW